jgi:acetolactate synthase regulatory subunit
VCKSLPESMQEVILKREYKDAQEERVHDLCIKKMHRKRGYAICALKRCTEREGMRSVHQKDAQKERVCDLCIKKMHRKRGCMICALKRCTEREGMRSVH